tara:strand:- start:61 stop:315 length:255 start_codon:yes stop_codon:yes gene_type:complete
MQTSADIINLESINMECYMNQVERDLLTKKNKNLNSCSIVFRDGKYIVVEETDFWRRGIMKKLPILLSLSIIALLGIFLTIVFK